MRITKVYTKTGDKGETSLVGGKRVSKASARVAAYGDVDELNSVIGLARTYIEDEEIDAVLRKLQNELFVIGADLASPLDVAVPRIAGEHISELEKLIDGFLKELKPLEEFILPGGSCGGALLHLARAVARRAERTVVKLASEDKINEADVIYLNRLSDLLFVLARVVNHRAGVAEEQARFTAK